MPRLLLAAGLLLPAAHPGVAHAQVSNFDISVQQADGQLLTGVLNKNGFTLTYPERVFTRSFRDVNGQLRADDPGFFALAIGNPVLTPFGLEGLPPGVDLLYDVLPLSVDGEVSNLVYWDGLDTGDGSLNAADVSWGDTEGLFLVVNASAGGGNPGDSFVFGDEELVTGNSIDTTQSNGLVHIHPEYSLLSLTGQPPAEGVYAFGMRLRVEGLEPTEPFVLAMLTPGITGIDPDASLEQSELYDAANAEIESAAYDWLTANIDSLFDVPAGPKGDFNGDGLVDAADYPVWRDAYELGEATIDDYITWRDNFGAGSLAPAVAGAAAVATPEPSAGVLLALAAGGLLRRRR